MRNGLLFLLAAAFSVCAKDPVLPVVPTPRVKPVVSQLAPPESLRPCCAFGYDLHVRAIGVPIPVYQIGNVLTLDTLGKHRYNDSALGAVKNLVGLSEEENGLIYTRRGGFIDIAHVRDTADNTFYLFSRIYPNLGKAGRIFYSEELGVRRIQLNAFMPPASLSRRYEIAAWLAGRLAYELAQWHENGRIKPSLSVSRNNSGTASAGENARLLSAAAPFCFPGTLSIIKKELYFRRLHLVSELSTSFH